MKGVFIANLQLIKHARTITISCILLNLFNMVEDSHKPNKNRVVRFTREWLSCFFPVSIPPVFYESFES